jgi:hypothetical protein
MERSEGDMSLRNRVTPPGIDPVIVRLVAQRLNHYATQGPLNHYVTPGPLNHYATPGPLIHYATPGPTNYQFTLLKIPEERIFRYTSDSFAGSSGRAV